MAYYWYKHGNQDEILNRLYDPKMKEQFDKWHSQGCPQCGSHRSFIKLISTRTAPGFPMRKFWLVNCATPHCDYHAHLAIHQEQTINI